MEINDRLVNLVSGLGTEKDKSVHSHFRYRPMLKYELDAMYSSSWLAGSMVDIPCDDLTREWRRWKGGKRQQAALLKTERRLRVRHQVNYALKMARLYGGAAIIIGDGTNDPSKPLDVEAIGKNGIKYLTALSRYEIKAGALDRDPLSPFYGEPTYYQITRVAPPPIPDPKMRQAPVIPGQTTTGNYEGSPIIHPSRVVRFLGQARLEVMTSFDGWGLSTLQRAYEAVRNVESTCSNLAAMTYEGKLDIISIPGLSQNVINPAYRDSLLQRFSLANVTKSVVNALVLDSEEKWEQKQVNFSNYPEVLRTYLEIAAGAADIPMTRLLGVQGKGLQNSGSADLHNYYDALAARQEVELRPAMERLDGALARDAGVQDADFDWLPLWQMRENEAAAVHLMNAQRNQIYATMSVCSPNALREGIQAQLVQDNIFPGLADTLEKHAGEDPAPLVEKKDVTGQEIDTPSAGARVPKE